MAKRNNIIVYSSDNNHGALLESQGEFLLFQNGTVFYIDIECFKSLKPNYTKFFEGHACIGFIKLAFGNAEAHFLILVTNCTSVGKLFETDVYKILATTFVPLNTNIPYEEEYNGISELKKFLNSGCFYFSEKNSLDLTLNNQKYFENAQTDDRFFWNRTLFSYLSQNGIRHANKWFAMIICGSIEIKTCYAGHQKAKLCLISRYGNERAGTRFNVRGADDNGFVANFVETEQIIYLDKETLVSSFVQIRGSVPVFWEQAGLQFGAHKIQLSRGFEATCPAYQKHFGLLLHLYENVVALNLLGSKEGEKTLSEAYQAHHKICPYATSVPMILFDYHAMCRNNKNGPQNLQKLWQMSIRPALGGDDTNFFYTSPQPTAGGRRQAVVIRTNCVDCIDRTNACQSYIAREILPLQMISLGIREQQLVNRFEEAFKGMWFSNGDRLSNIYAGTGAMECKGKLREGALSVSRTIQSNFLDDSRQLAIDLILGSGIIPPYLPYVRAIIPIGYECLSPELTETIYYWQKEFSAVKSTRIFIGTWNVNGGRALSQADAENLAEWLNKPIYKTGPKEHPPDGGNDILPDIYVVGFQEIIDLSAKNIAIAASTENQRIWESQIHDILKLKGHYVSLVSAQLVGVCLFLFTTRETLPYLKDVSLCKVKTGLGGATGNKGGVALRFTHGLTSYIFICAHLAAGQSQVKERNADVAEIARAINIFPNFTLGVHDYVFWFGDFNYRVDMPIDSVKDYIKNGRWSALWAAEQLTLQKQQGSVFKGFQEGQLDFAPTYKYDLNSDRYDTSDKCRVPAWTDRILWKNQARPGFELDPATPPSRLLVYGRAELKTSDHRPVYAIIDTLSRDLKWSALQSNMAAIVRAAGPLDKTVVVGIELTNPIDWRPEPRDILASVEASLTQSAGEIIWSRFNQGEAFEFPLISNENHRAIPYDYQMLVTFSRGYQAFYALKLDCYPLTPNPEHSSVRVRVRPLDPEWESFATAQLTQCFHVNHLHYALGGNERAGSKKEESNYFRNGYAAELMAKAHPDIADAIDLTPDIPSDALSDHITTLPINENKDVMKKSYASETAAWPDNRSQKVLAPPRRPPPPKISSEVCGKAANTLLDLDFETEGTTTLAHSMIEQPTFKNYISQPDQLLFDQNFCVPYEEPEKTGARDMIGGSAFYDQNTYNQSHLAQDNNISSTWWPSASFEVDPSSIQCDKHERNADNNSIPLYLPPLPPRRNKLGPPNI